MSCDNRALASATLNCGTVTSRWSSELTIEARVNRPRRWSAAVLKESGIDRTPCLLDLDALKGYRLSAARRAGGRHLGNGQEKGRRRWSVGVYAKSLYLSSC
jgi:hypothetical protein